MSDPNDHKPSGSGDAPRTVPPPDDATRTAETMRLRRARDGNSRADAREGPGSELGSYKLLQLLGEGGFGRVYEAQQSAPVRRRVALKIVKLGMETDRVIARFEAERQALALMDHPSIAKVFDAGTTETGRPYFVMELVKGMPITRYCDQHHLEKRQRLELFLEVCHAVQHAHQKGVIHRDLKPSNVLVEVRSGRPMPKVIDFGIAKALSTPLTERTLVTEIHLFMGTPDYMSPEQAAASGLDVDTRSDVYSLGVLLYELLTGVTPFDFKARRPGGPTEIERILRDEDPPTPSSRVTATAKAEIGPRPRLDQERLRRELRGDLDWIVMKALEKDRTRRYETVNALAEDLRRHLRDEPVMAGPPDVRYRLAKWMRRHRVAFIAGAAVTTTLLLGIVGTTWGLWRAAAEAQEARRQTERAEAVNAFLNQDLLAAAAPSAERGRGRDVTMREVLDGAAERLEESARPGGRFEGQPEIEVALRRTLADTYMALGEYALADVQLSRALRRASEQWGERSPPYGDLLALLAALRNDQGRFEEAEALYREAIEISRQVRGPTAVQTLRYGQHLANVYRGLGRFEEAEDLSRETLASSRTVLGPEHDLTLDLMGSLANLLQESNRCEEALEIRRELHATLMRVYGERHLDTIATTSNLANDLSCVGELDEAGALMRRALELKQEIYGPNHPTTSNSRLNLAELEAQRGRFEESAALHRAALEARLETLGERHPRTLLSMERLALVLTTLGRHREAEPLAREAAAICTETQGAAHPQCLWTHGTLAEVLLGLGEPEAARRVAESQLAIIADLEAAPGDPDSLAYVEHELRFRLGRALAALGQLEEAEDLLVTSIEHWPAHEARTRRAYLMIADFFDERARGEPNGDWSARAEEWRRRAKMPERASSPAIH